MKTIQIQYSKLPKNTPTPIFTYCRKLILKGEEIDTRLEIFRNNIDFDIVIPKIGEAAKLSVKEEPSPHFIKYSIPKDIYRNRQQT